MVLYGGGRSPFAVPSVRFGAWRGLLYPMLMESSAWFEKLTASGAVGFRVSDVGVRFALR